MLYRILILSLFVGAPLLAQRGDRADIDQSTVPSHWDIPPAPVLTAEEALETFVLQPGFRIELVASEPLLHDPVAIDFDEDGRIWAVEMRSYMPNVDGTGELEPVSRVVVLEDTNGDGRMDTSSVFMDNLTLPRAIRVMEGGVLIGEPPYVWFARDTTGDGRADERIMVTDTYSRRGANPEHAANGLLLGFDNWVHSAMHDRRYRLVDGEWIYEPAISRGQWGISQDNYGRHYSNPNAYYLHVDQVPNHYYPRNSHLTSSHGVYYRMDSDRRVWPIRITPGVNRRVQLSSDGMLETFTATCAPLSYRGDNFPSDFVGDVFVAEPAGNLIRRAKISEDSNGVLTSRNAYERAEFLASTDERFRPVNLYNAPDGSLYIVDMYRGILQHRQFVTTFLRRQILDRGLDEPLGLGRIYRVVHESAEPGPGPRLSEKTSAELVPLLAHANGWWRDTAQRLLVEKKDQSVVPALREMAAGHEDELARIHALWTLEGLGGLEKPMLIDLMGSSNRDIRIHALRAAEVFFRDSPEGGIWAKAIELTFDNDPRVRVQAALSLGELPESGTKKDVLADLLWRYPNQPFLREAVLSGLKGEEMDVLGRIVARSSGEDSGDDVAQIIQLLSAAVMRERNADRIERLFHFIVTDEPPTWQKLAVLGGIRASDVRRLNQRPTALDVTPQDPEVARLARTVFARLEFPDETRVELEVVRDPEVLNLLAKGGDLYQLNCAACHQPEGLGMEGLATPLVASEWVLGDERHLIRIVLDGKEGDLGMMPPMGSALNDEDFAAILTYIRRSWGNVADPVRPAAINILRQTSERTTPWTAEELRELSD